MRGLAALLALCLAAPAGAQHAATRVSGAPATCVESILGADYDWPTTRYDHGILGDAVEWGGMRVNVRGKLPCRWGSSGIDVILPDTMVFEDVEPRLADVTGDGLPEVIVVETSLTQGARLAVWGLRDGHLDRLATTPFIGQTHRWLAPIVAVDLDGDGRIEIAYVDRPHLAKTLRIWRYADGRLTPVADRAGLTNHRIGDTTITSGLRTCGGTAELVLVDADWLRIVAARLVKGRIQTRDLGPYDGPRSLQRQLACS